MKALLLNVTAFLLFLPVVSAQERRQQLDLPVGKALYAIHLPTMSRTIRALPASNEHDVFYMEDMATVAGVKPEFLMLEADIQNAFALFDGEIRFIVYDPKWFHGRTASRRYGTAVARHAVLAHEIGHHVCKHTSRGSTRTSWERELEADQFEGAVLARLSRENSYIKGLTLDELLATEALNFMSPEGSASHPPKTMRLEAIKKGWYEGTACGK